MQHYHRTTTSGDNDRPLRNPLRSVGSGEEDLGMEARPVLPGKSGRIEGEEEGDGRAIAFVFGLLMVAAVVGVGWVISRVLISLP